MASAPHEPSNGERMVAVMRHGITEENRSSRDVIWFPHNTPRFPGGRREGHWQEPTKRSEGCQSQTPPGASNTGAGNTGR